MKNILFILLLWTAPAFATNYYFSALSGNDGNPGTQAQPLQTVSKMNQIAGALAPGDHIFLKSGESFPGQLTVGSSGAFGNPVVFETYGGSAPATITGFANLSSWAHQGGNIWRAVYSVPNRLNVVLIGDGNGAPLVMRDRGRWPNLNNGNGGYRTFYSHEGFSTVTDASLPAALGGTNPVGAELTLRSVRWISSTYLVTAFNTGTGKVTYAGNQPEMQLEPNNGAGYFFQNALWTLDVQNEWWYDGIGLDIYSTVNPGLLGVKVAIVDTLVKMMDRNFITFRNIAMQGANKCIVYSLRGQSIRYENCKIDFSGGTCIKGDQTIDATAIGGSATNSNYRGIDFTPNCTRAAILYNNIDSNGVHLTLAGNGNLANIAAFVQGNGAVIRYNTIHATGYNGAVFTGANDSIEYNYVTEYNLYFDDGAGIYTSDTGRGRAIRFNTVMYGRGSPYGSGSLDGAAANGIGLDDANEKVWIEGNTVAFNSREGLGIHNGDNNTVINNTFFGDGQRELYWEHDILQPSRPIYGLYIRGNTFVSLSSKSSLSNLNIDYYNILMGGATRRDRADFLNFGTSDYNKFRKPKMFNNNDDFIRGFYRYVPPGSDCTGCGTDDSVFRYRVPATWGLNIWQRETGQDLHSTASTFKIPFTVNSTGPELYPNNSFTSNISDTRNQYPGRQTATFTTNGINGGSLRADYTGSSRSENFSVLLYHEGGQPTVNQGGLYVLKFQHQAAAENVTFKIAVLSDFGAGGTGGQLDTIYTFKSDIYRKDVEQYIYAEKTLTKTYISISTDSSGLCPWFLLRNVSFKEVTSVSFADPAQYIQLIPNPSVSPLQIVTDGSWMNEDGIPWPKIFYIAPWGNAILVKNPNAIMKVGKVMPILQ